MAMADTPIIIITTNIILGVCVCGCVARCSPQRGKNINAPSTETVPGSTMRIQMVDSVGFDRWRV